MECASRDVILEVLDVDERAVLDVGLEQIRAAWDAVTSADLQLLVRAADQASVWHHGQRRRSGDPYITHPLAVAELVASWGMDRASVLAAVLHDVVEDTPATLDDVAELFEDDGELAVQVRSLVDGLTKIDGLRISDLAGSASVSRTDVKAATFSKLLLALIADTRVLVVKLADRLHNVRTLDALPPAKAARIASETMDVFAPLAKRLGISQVGSELEDRCFAVLLPERHVELRDQVAALVGERSSWLAEVIGELEASLAAAGVRGVVAGREKSLWSTYDKMVSKHRTLDQVYDLIGVRIIVKTVEDCYTVLGVVHRTFPPMAGRVKDWIATPRNNAYQSLHTTVIGPRGAPIEVQIRTDEMHLHAEWGVAAHWRYKHRHATEASQMRGEWADRLAGLSAAPRGIGDDAHKFLAQLRAELGGEEVFCFTPDGDVIALPDGATVVDFAYAVHTDIGHGCRGAKVNSRPSTLDTRLRTGDRVEIVTGRQGGPNRAWLDFVASAKARDAIRGWFARSRRLVEMEAGERAVIEALDVSGMPAMLAGRKHLEKVSWHFGQANATDLLLAVHQEQVRASDVAAALRGDLSGLERPASPPRKSRARPVTMPAGAIVVDGADDVTSRLCPACTPRVGEPICGVLGGGRRSKFVMIHRNNCPEIGDDVTLPAAWTGRHDLVAVRLVVSALDRAGLFAEQAAALTAAGGDIAAVTGATGSDMVARARFDVRVADPSETEQLREAMMRVPGVFSVRAEH